MELSPLRPWGLTDACVAIAIFSLLFVQSADFARDPGVGWHLKTGQFILESGQVPHGDPFLYLPTSLSGPQGIPGERGWVSDQWLGDLLLYTFYRVGSWPLLYSLGCSLFCITFFGILYRGMLPSGTTRIAAAIACIAAFKLAQVHFILRPVIFSFPLFALLFIQAVSIRDEVWRNHKFALRRRILFLAPVFLLWANLHPSFVLGLLLLLILSFSFGLDALLFNKAAAAGKRAALDALVLTVVCLLATLFNPYFFDLHRSIFSLGQSAYFMSLNEEWHSPNFQEYSGFVFELALLFVLAVALAVNSKARRLYALEIVSLLLFAHASLQSIRMFPFFGIVLAPTLARSFEALGDIARLHEIPVLRLLPAACANLEQRESRSWQGQLLLWFFVMVLIITSLLWPAKLSSFAPGLEPSRGYFPYAALDLLKSKLAPDSQFVVAASPNWGGFITWQGFPQIRPIIDDRNTLIGENFYKEFFKKLKAGADWQGYLAQLEVTHLLLQRESNLAGAILESGKLAVLHQDEVAILFEYE